ncbi:thioesterase family protein [Salinarimonas sp.]|uniref:acyl-CoA thioesterase n=1 Tax=Salinarimonas sp. TaxID=2766526 RepID=UPI0032D940A2
METTSVDIATLRSDPRVVIARDVLRFSDCDSLGHVNNVVFATLCESGRVRFAEERLLSHLPDGSAIVLARLAIDFRRELHYPGEVETATWLSRVGRSSMTLSQAILSGDTMAATAEGVIVAIDLGTRKPVQIKGEARAALEAAMMG